MSWSLGGLVPVDPDWIQSDEISNCVEEQPKHGGRKSSQGYNENYEVEDNLVSGVVHFNWHGMRAVRGSRTSTSLKEKRGRGGRLLTRPEV